MQNTEIPLADQCSSEVVQQSIAHAVESKGLSITSFGTLSSYPGCLHWHFKKDKLSGTMEATFWPKRNRLWLSVHANRGAAWIDEALPDFIADIKRGLSSYL